MAFQIFKNRRIYCHKDKQNNSVYLVFVFYTKTKYQKKKNEKIYH